MQSSSEIVGINSACNYEYEFAIGSPSSALIRIKSDNYVDGGLLRGGTLTAGAYSCRAPPQIAG